MARYIDVDKLLQCLPDDLPYKASVKRVLIQAPTADIVEAKYKNPNDESCVICNSELDEKGAGGIWDLAGEICEVLMLDNEHEEQDTIYNIIREYIKQQKHCPRCGAKMDGKVQKVRQTRMTENEIMEAVERCVNGSADDCDFCNFQGSACRAGVISESLSLINRKNAKIAELTEEVNRQKAEIERLRKETSQTIESIRKLARDTIRDTKSEAIKEFAERAKAEFQPEQNYDNIANFTIKLFTNTIDNLVKEMTESNK